MKKTLFLIFLILANIHAINLKKIIQKNNCSKLEQFNKYQLKNIIKSYIWGLPYGLENILPAIAWQESCAGLYKLNMYDPSAGLYHAYLPSVMARHKGLKDTKFNQNKVAQMLVNDDKFAVSEAISELLFWKNFYKNNNINIYNLNKLIIMSYNRGKRWWKKNTKNRHSAENYYKNVNNKMKKIKSFFYKYNIKKEILKTYHIKQ